MVLSTGGSCNQRSHNQKQIMKFLTHMRTYENHLHMTETIINVVMLGFMKYNAEKCKRSYAIQKCELFLRQLFTHHKAVPLA